MTNSIITAQNLDLINTIEDKYNIEKIIGHYQVDDKKECPSFDVPGWLEENGLV